MILLSLGCCSVCTSGLYCRLFVVAVFVSVDDIVGSCSGCTSVRETQSRAASHGERTPAGQAPAQPAPTQDVVRRRHHAAGHALLRGKMLSDTVIMQPDTLFLEVIDTQMMLGELVRSFLEVIDTQMMLGELVQAFFYYQ